MVFLRKVTIHDQDYHYLFYCEKNPFKKYKKYIGKKQPTKQELKKLTTEFLEEITKNPDTQNITEQNVIALLQEIQETNKFVSEEAIIKISKEMGIPAVELYGVLTFYSQFKLKAPGKNHICVCRGTACHVKKSDELLKIVEEELNVKTGNTSKNGEFSLEAVNCVGACARAPVMTINEKLYGQLDKEKTKKIISQTKNNKK